MAISKRQLMLRAFARQCQKINRIPTMREFTNETGFTKDMVTYYFGSINTLFKDAKKKFPKMFKNCLNDVLTPENINKQKKEIKDYSRFIITTSVTGCVVDTKFLKSIENYCAKNDAKLLVLMSTDPAASVTNRGFVDPAISRDSIVASNISLNSNIHVSTIKLSAKHIEPTTGLLRLGQGDGSFIYASPKQRLKPVPVANSKHPHVIMTTGAITKPNYNTDKYMSERTAYIADYDHVLGAVIVEIEDDKVYHYRQIQASEDGSFADFGVRYYADKIEDEAPIALIAGDIHSGSEDKCIIECYKKTCEDMNIDTLVAHDVYDGMSVNRHEMDNNILRAIRQENDQLNLDAELMGVACMLKNLAESVKNVVVVKSNHDEFLERYLKDGSYIKDPQNHRVALKLALYMLDDLNPIEQYVQNDIKLSLDEYKIRFLKQDESFKMAGVELGQHGHVGNGGARGSIAGLELAYGDIIFGHTHSPEILRKAVCVGTSTSLRLTYNRGGSSWLNTFCLLYKDGSRQLINVINGKCHL